MIARILDDAYSGAGVSGYQDTMITSKPSSFTPVVTPIKVGSMIDDAIKAPVQEVLIAPTIQNTNPVTAGLGASVQSPIPELKSTVTSASYVNGGTANPVEEILSDSEIASISGGGSGLNIGVILIGAIVALLILKK
jgi:hypothetical protein